MWIKQTKKWIPPFCDMFNLWEIPVKPVKLLLLCIHRIKSLLQVFKDALNLTLWYLQSQDPSVGDFSISGFVHEGLFFKIANSIWHTKKFHLLNLSTNLFQWFTHLPIYKHQCQIRGSSTCWPTIERVLSLRSVFIKKEVGTGLVTHTSWKLPLSVFSQFG